MMAQKREPVFTDLIHMAYVSSIQKMAMPSLSYDPATEREMYPGTMEIMAAATSPAPASYNEIINSLLNNVNIHTLDKLEIFTPCAWHNDFHLLTDMPPVGGITKMPKLL